MRAVLLVFLLASSAFADDFDSLYRAVVEAYDVAKSDQVPEAKRREAIASGITAADRALALRPEATEALVYKSLLQRQLGSLAKDDAERERLYAAADATRNEAIAIINARRKKEGLPTGWTTWEVWIIQDDKIRFPENDVVTLDRRPFSIWVMMPELAPVMLNASTDDRVFKRIVDGFDLVKDCKGEVVAMCGGTGMAEEPFNKGKQLIPGPDRMHYLYYDSPQDHRLTRHGMRGTIHQLERDVARIGDTPLEKTKNADLYLLFAVRTHDDGKLHEDELRRVRIRFR